MIDPKAIAYYVSRAMQYPAIFFQFSKAALFPRCLLAIAFSAFFLTVETFGQGYKKNTQSSTSMYYTLRRYLGEVPYFAADAATSLTTADKTLVSGMERITIAPGIFRRDSDASSLKTPSIPPERLATMKRIGMNRSVFLLNIKQGRFYFIYPDANVHHVERLSPEFFAAAESANLRRKISREFVSRETVNGYSCEKYRLVLSDPKGRTQEGMIWTASSLGGVPVKMDIPEDDKRVGLSFSNISTNVPLYTLLDVPTNSVEKATADEIFRAANENWAQRLIDKAKAKD